MHQPVEPQYRATSETQSICVIQSASKPPNIFGRISGMSPESRMARAFSSGIRRISSARSTFFFAKGTIVRARSIASS
jgi:hypothetical protein